jgi:hypothetical protein
VQTMSSIRRDFVASHLRYQLNRLRSILDNIEEDKQVDSGYTGESLKEIETGLRQIRRLCVGVS